MKCLTDLGNIIHVDPVEQHLITVVLSQMPVPDVNEATRTTPIRVKEPDAKTFQLSDGVERVQLSQVDQTRRIETLHMAMVSDAQSIRSMNVPCLNGCSSVS